MRIFISNSGIEATVTTKPEKISLDNSELYKLIQDAFGYSKTRKVEYGLREDTYCYTETYGDEADKELLRLIKIRLDKKPEQLKPVTRRWET